MVDFVSDRLVAVCNPLHPLSDRSQIHLSGLDGEKFVGFEKGIPTRLALDRLFEEQQVAVHYVTEIDNIETIKRLVEVGVGIAVIPENSCVNEVKSGSLIAIKLVDAAVTRPIGILHRTGKHFSPATERFIEYLRASSTRQGLGPAGPVA